MLKIRNPECAGFGGSNSKGKSYLFYFGAGDVIIKNGCLNSNDNENCLGHNYHGINDNGHFDQENKTYLGGTINYTVKEIECFHFK